MTRPLLLLVATLVLAGNAVADTLEEIQQRGRLFCGVNIGLSGFAEANSLGEYRGFDVDLCRAVAAATLGDVDSVDYIPLSARDRFEELVSGRVDLLSRNTTWTLERDSLFGEFAGVTFYDGQGFMVHRSSGIRSALELDNAPICVSRNTTSELNVADFFKVSEIRFQPVYGNDDKDVIENYIEKRCVAYTTDRSGLAAYRSSFDQPNAHLILPEVISKEPLGPMVRSDDSVWEGIVRWTHNCMVNAEEMGVTSDNVDTAAVTNTPARRRLLGVEGNAGEQLGLDAQWCQRIIRDVGNYGESYERHLGESTPLELPRSINKLWTDGGLLYAPPIR